MSFVTFIHQTGWKQHLITDVLDEICIHSFRAHN